MQRILNANHSDRLKISASQMLFGNMLDLDAGIFDKFSSRSASEKPLSKYMSNLQFIQDNLLKVSAKELLRTDLLHLTTKGRTNTQNTQLILMFLFITAPVYRRLVCTRVGRVQYK